MGSRPLSPRRCGCHLALGLSRIHSSKPRTAVSGGAHDPKQSTQKGDCLRPDNPDKNKTHILEHALKPEEGLTQEEALRGANSHPEHGQRRKDQTEPDDPTQFHLKSKGVNLRQVYPSPENKTATDVDIIAIHGLDTQSPDTWTWDPKGACVNWLEDPHMLPERFPTARIFTCDWPADLFEQPGFVQKMIDEFARLLLAGIKGRPPVADDQPGRDRPIVFIASCLGGIILAKTLVIASYEYESVKRATRGIVFLATSFGGTSFQRVATWAEPGLRLWASIRDKKVSNLLELAKPTFDLRQLVRSFTAFCLENDLKGHVVTFYETGKSTNAPQLVDIDSATLQIVPHPLPLDRPHVTMNKFSGPDDPGYVLVAGRLRIERLSGVLLPMDRCYINLAIVEQQPGDKTSPSDDEGRAQKDSPFSLLARLNIMAPDKTINSRGGQEKQPMGKTTLCKKIDLFDRVLWSSGYNFGHLFHHEYFSQLPEGDGLARALTLFVLDGLDEFLKKLLNQPDVIITSRPHAILTSGLDPIQLELETIGFYPDQVKTGETDSKKPGEVQSYLQKHQLVQGLVRIPVQLDALCSTWSSLSDKVIPQTMTAIYRAIEQSLWRKDIVRLGKQQPNRPQVVTHDHVQELLPSEVENFIEAELSLLEGLAFTEHRDTISRQFKSTGARVPLDTTCTRLSFLRMSELSSNSRNRNYHFLHLTFQEYFAARYFVRHNRDCSSKVEPATFLQKHKYDPRYDIFWRFVAGLLDADGGAPGFFQTIEREPRDLLGPTHQRLVMHCLSELETELEQWLLFECDFTKSSELAREIECLEQNLLRSIFRRTAIPSSIINIVSSWLNDDTSKHLYNSILYIIGHQRRGLPDTVLQGIVARLEDNDSDVRRAAIKALQGQAGLAEEVLQHIVAQLEDTDFYVRRAAIERFKARLALPRSVRRAAIEALQGQAGLAEEVLQRIAARLEDDDFYVQRVAIEAFMNQEALSLDVLGPYIKPLYKAFLHRSFKEHIYWYTSDSEFIGVGFEYISLSSR
ncbi:hypothetical protein B0T26DRAFT_701827 [Lasiosphaeria miniovina]|uniref:Protein SERAC1 n=1 Tax=Lasiosphaeria miniovina TaxID=1954250 RepID=A0AA40E081_9PEZI|nr:uncharacterized protein B0T26DRAFT_701827 [Lasiosphaeria miniovina]KAK0722210.1 hypothetical protein B0T26DRAFT_701827 [Lasiosphaeria miniovina]